MTDRKKDKDPADLVVVDQILPVRLPILPLFSRPVFPEMLTPVIVTDDRLVRIIRFAQENGGYIGLLLTRNEQGDIDPDNLYDVGVVAKILKRVNLPDGSVNIFVNSIKRMEIKKITSVEPVLYGIVVYPESANEEDDEVKALYRALLSGVKEITANNALFTEEVRMSLLNVRGMGKLADFVSSILNVTREEQQEILEDISLKSRLARVLKLIMKEKELLLLQRKIQDQIEEKITTQQREFFLKEQLKAIRQELGMEMDEKTSNYNRFKQQLGSLDLSEEAEAKLTAELEKLKITDNHSPEYGVIRSYLDTALSLPWNSLSDDRIDIEKAAKLLDQDHFGLDKVKKRILEFLAVQVLKKTSRGSILCLVGPPGVGKTSLGRSISRAMNRKFFRFSLGGMRDEAEIKGHRRTYVGAIQGKILEALKICKTRNPVLMLDEIDKLGKSFQGDPSSALLEVLDPEQNARFRDHYLDIPFDLSDVFFITTANTLDTIPRPLLDRMEVMRLSGYISEEKAQIARRYLIPKALEENGLPRKFVSLNKAALLEVVNGYAREAGVRHLEKLIHKIMRGVAYDHLTGEQKKALSVGSDEIKKYLGEPYFREDRARKLDSPGLALGLAWTSMGGDVLTVECLSIPGKSGLKLTGKLGSVMSESAGIAFSYIRRAACDTGCSSDFFSENSLHLHVPAGATPKDGPSAGITMASAMLSLALGRKIRGRLAMTGELSLSGDVLPIGGLKEKVIAAKRSGVKEVIFPLSNLSDLEEIPEYVKKGIVFYSVSRMEEVRKIIFTKGKVEFTRMKKY